MLVLVGELNPYGPRPSLALLDAPPGSAGERMRRVVLDIPSRDYRALPRYNLCDYSWSASATRARVPEIARAHPGAVLVLLGRKVGDAFGCRFAPDDPWGVPSFTEHLLDPDRGLDHAVALLPHPSGLNRLWNDPATLPRVREVLDLAAPGWREKTGLRG